ncbi:hypothetical protein AKJ16_DCAP23295 [Drosera capensis]
MDLPLASNSQIHSISRHVNVVRVQWPEINKHQRARRLLPPHEAHAPRSRLPLRKGNRPPRRAKRLSSTMAPPKFPKCPNNGESPTCSFDKFNHWKLRMLAHLNSIDERMQDILLDGPNVPMMSDPNDSTREVQRPKSL